MKRKAGILLAILVVTVAALVLLRPGRSAFEPTYRPVTTPPTLGPSTTVHYDFLALSPFEGGKMWVMASGGTNRFNCYLYDLDQRRVLGELLYAQPCFLSGDGSQLLCSQRAPRRTLLTQVQKLLARITGGKVSMPLQQRDLEVFYVVDLKTGAARRLGQVEQWSGSGSKFIPSPDFRRGYNTPVDPERGTGFYLADLETGAFKRIESSGYPSGWWSTTEILIGLPPQGQGSVSGSFVLYDVETGRTNDLLSARDLVAFLDEAKIDLPPSAPPSPFYQWTGHDNDFYITDAHARWSATNSFLLRLEKPDGALRVVSPDFKFEWSDHFHPRRPLYLYSGRGRGTNSTAVFLRDLETGVDRVLVPPDGNQPYHSVPRFYGDTVIYMRSNALWQIGIDGSEPRRLFPPE